MTIRLIVSGELNSGKTSLCRLIAAELKDRNWDTAGILTLGIFVEAEKVAFDIHDIRTGDSLRLAEVTERGTSMNGPSTKHWTFSDDALAWANKVLSQSTPCQVLIVDELGPLEFEQDTGLLSGIEAIETGDYTIALIVIRQHMLDHALELWPEARVERIKSIDQVPLMAERIVASLGHPSKLMNTPAE